MVNSSDDMIAMWGVGTGDDDMAAWMSSSVAMSKVNSDR